MGMGRLPGLSLAINMGRPPYPGERPRLQGVIIISLPQGYPRFKASQKKSKNQKGFQQNLKKSLDQKINSQNFSAEYAESEEFTTVKGNS